MNIRKFVDKYKRSKPVTTTIEEEEEKEDTQKNPFAFKYNSICPAISILILNRSVLNTPGRIAWLSELFNLFNKSMNSTTYKITEHDLISPHKWFNETFGHDVFFNAKDISNNPLLWGKYIWSLLHIVSLFWTPETNSSIVYLFQNVNYILPCEECQKHYIDLINKYKNDLYNITSLVSSVNFIINLREVIGKKSKKTYNRIPDGDYSFLEIYNYLLPLVEPETKTGNFSGALLLPPKCNCKNKKI